MIDGANFNARVHHGGRFTLGYRLDCERTWGIEGNYFFASAGSRSVGATSPGDVNLGDAATVICEG